MPLYSPIEDTGCNWMTKQIQKNKYWNIPLGQGTVTTQVAEAWKLLRTLWLLQLSSQWSFWPQAFWRATMIALLEVYQRKKLKGCGVQLQPWPLQSSSAPYWQERCTHWSILFFWTQPAIVFWPDCPTVTPPLSYPEKNSNQGTPGHPEGMEKKNRWVLVVISAPSTSHTTLWLPTGKKYQLESLNCRK